MNALRSVGRCLRFILIGNPAKVALSTAILLVLLRLAIGWHFLFEGVHKIEATQTGKTETNKPFTSIYYFREAPGPMGKVMRHFVGDPNDEALALLSVQPVPEGKDERTYPPKDRVPPALDAEWKAYLDRFSAYYELDEQQRKAAQDKLDQAETDAVHWLTDTTHPKEVAKTFPGFVAPVKLQEAAPERIAEFRVKMAELRDAQERKNSIFARDVEGNRLAERKAEVTKLRTGLMNDFNKDNTDKLKAALTSLVTPEQLEKAKDKDKTALDAPPSRVLTWIDWLTMWGLTVMGGCLIVGLFTRLNCILAAGFLLMLYLSAPPFPWLPVLEKTNSHYLFVNQILIEMIALLALATTASGRWLGLDALIDGFFSLLAPRSTASKTVVLHPEPTPISTPTLVKQ